MSLCGKPELMLQQSARTQREEEKEEERSRVQSAYVGSARVHGKDECVRARGGTSAYGNEGAREQQAVRPMECALSEAMAMIRTAGESSWGRLHYFRREVKETVRGMTHHPRRVFGVVGR